MLILILLSCRSSLCSAIIRGGCTAYYPCVGCAVEGDIAKKVKEKRTRMVHFHTGKDLERGCA